jgi:hypothetical protein
MATSASVTPPTSGATALFKARLKSISFQTTSELFVICGSKNDEILLGGFGAIVGSMLDALIIGLISSSVFFVLLVILQSILATLNMDESRRQMMSGAMLLVLVPFYGRGRAMRA